MFPFEDPSSDTTGVDDLLDQIDVRRATQVQAVRDGVAARVQTRVTVRPGSFAERDRAIALTTSEIGPQSVLGIAARPLLVGDVFHLTFAEDSGVHGPVFAICDRCTLLGENAFELRFRPLQTLHLPPPDDRSA